MGWHYLSIAVVLICLAVSGNVHASDLRQATTRLDEGRYDEALKAYLDAASEGQPAAVRAEAEGGAGLVYFLTGRISEAEKAFRKSLGQAEAAGRRDLAARSAMNLIQVRLRQNNRSSVLPWVSGIAVQSPERADPDSLDWAESAVRYASKEQRVDLEVKARVLYARTAIGAEYRARVLRELTTALERASGPEPYAEGWLLIADAAINRAYAERSDAYDQVAYRALTRVTDKDDGAIRARSMALLGRLYARAGRLDTALSLTGEAELLATQARDEASQLEYSLQKAVLLQKGTHPADVDLAYVRVVSLVQALRPSVAQLSDLEQRAYLHALMLQALESRVAYLLTTGDQDQKRLREARYTLELGRLVDLEKYFADACIRFGISEVRDIEELDPQAAVLYPILLEDRLVVLASAVNPSSKTVQIQRFERRVSRHEVVAQAHALSETIRDRGSDLPAARALYDYIVRDAVHALKSQLVRTLVFSPNQELRNVPWAALHDGRAYTIETYAVSTTLGLSLINPEPVNRKSPRLVMAGLKAGDENVSTLEGIDQEFETLETLLPVRPLREDTFTSANLKKAVEEENPTVLHIASHAFFSPYAAENYIRAYGSRISLTELRALVAPVSGTALDMLVLSACDTAHGEPDAVLGMAGSAYQAGARSVVGGLWPVDDKTTPVVMRDFYTGIYKNQMSKAEALRQAQLNRLRAGDAPYLWAPYILLGNWM